MAIVTQESVFTAADALAAKGVTVTQNAIRAELGGGSYSTIGGFLNQWREQRAPAPAPAAPADPVPDGLRERLEGLLAATWSEANDAANARLEAARASLEASRAALEREKADAVAFADAASADLDAARADLEAARATIAQLTADADAQAKEHAAQLAAGADLVDQLQKQLASTEAAHMATQAAKAELGHVLDTTRSELQAAQGDVARLTGDLKAAQAREAAEARTATAADKRATQAQAKADKAGEELANLRAALEGLRTKAKDEEARAAQFQAEAIAARMTLVNVQQQLDDLTKPAKDSA